MFTIIKNKRFKELVSRIEALETKPQKPEYREYTVTFKGGDKKFVGNGYEFYGDYFIITKDNRLVVRTKEIPTKISAVDI